MSIEMLNKLAKDQGHNMINVKDGDKWKLNNSPELEFFLDCLRSMGADLDVTKMDGTDSYVEGAFDKRPVEIDISRLKPLKK